MKIAVIGTGSMGKNHVRVLQNIPDVREICIAEIDREALDKTVRQFGIAKAYDNCSELLNKEKPDGVIIATEPENHKLPAMEAMDQGIAVLVEKPIASSLVDAEEMIEKSTRTGVILTVGHTERFNPVISKIRELIDNKTLSNLYLVNTHRIGPFPKRFLGKEEGVLIDLAVHDFDIINYLCGKIEKIDSQIINGSGQEIYVRTLMDVEHDIKASSEFSWVSPRRVRTIEIYSGSGMILGDYFKKEAWFYANSDYKSELDNSILQNGLINYGKVVECSINKQEPLLLELVNFLCAIKGQCQPFVKPVDAKIALSNALHLKGRKDQSFAVKM